MILTETQKILNALRENQTFGDYALLINYRGEETLLTSEGVDAYTYFDNASLGKVLITAPLILRAVGEGKLSLDAVLPDFFADVPHEMRTITIRQLLTHTSGILRFELPEETRSMNREQQADLLLSKPLGYAPDTDYRYSCNGYILLGFIAEKIYGAPLDVLFEQYIRAPLGLVRSRFNIAVDEPNAVVSYHRQEVGDLRADDRNVRMLNGIAGNGAQFWCVRDMDTFMRAVLNRDARLYAPQLFAMAEQNYTPNFEDGRGLGWLIVNERYPQTGKLFPVGSFGHCGHTGMSIFANREMELYVILATNATRYANIRNQFRGYNYGDTMKMREIVHNAIHADLFS